MASIVECDVDRNGVRNEKFLFENIPVQAAKEIANAINRHLHSTKYWKVVDEGYILQKWTTDWRIA